MSGTQVSPFAPANALFDLGQVYQSYDRHQNALLQQQEAQQGLGAREMEYMARASAGLLDSYPDEAARAAAYPGVVAELQRYGYAKNAPSAYPGEAALRRIQAMGTSAADQFKLSANARTNESLLGRTGTPQPGAPGTGAPATTVAAPSGDIEPEAVTRANAVRDGLMKRGMDPETATAFAANALHESSAKPDTGAGDGGRSHGLFQWNADRLAAYQAKFGHAPDNAPLDEQLDFVMHELGGSESLARGRIASAQGVAGKAAQVSEAYLRPKDTVAEMQRRSATALRLAQQGLSAPASGQPTSDTAWLDNQARMYPNLAGPNAPAQPPAGGPGAPGRVQVASVTPTGPGGSPTATDATPAPVAPQNTLATPGVGPQPAPAATQPPAQPQAPATPRPQPPAPMVRDNLTAGDIAELGQLTRSLTPAQFEAAKYQRQQANVARQEKYQADVRTWENDQYTRQKDAATERRAQHTADLADRTAARADEKAARELADANKPYQGSGIEAQDGNILDAGDDGSRVYAGAYARQAAPRVNADGSKIIPNMTAYDKPTYRGGKGQAAGDGVPDYGTVETTPPTTLNATQSLAAGFADRMRNSLPIIADTSPAAMSRWQILLGKAPVVGNSLVSPEFQQHMQAERDFINAVLRRESGAAISEPEFINARQQYIPQPGDSQQVQAQKQKNRETVLANLVRDAGPGYKPPAATEAKPPSAADRPPLASFAR